MELIKNKQPHPLTQIKWGVLGIATYRGCIVSKIIGGYSYLNQKYLTPELIDEAINKNCKVIDNSILKD